MPHTRPKRQPGSRSAKIWCGVANERTCARGSIFSRVGSPSQWLDYIDGLRGGHEAALARFPDGKVQPRMLTYIELPLGMTSLRSELRAQTSPTHEKLDLIVGNFDSRSEYLNYVRGAYVFRQAVESSLSKDDEWPMMLLASMAKQDLVDLGSPVPDLQPWAFECKTPAEHLGVLYVLEGSALGATLLFRRARQLGMNEHFGARHLAMQSAGEAGRWRAFLQKLEAANADSHADAARAAQAAFEFALSIHAEAARERA